MLAGHVGQALGFLGEAIPPVVSAGLAVHHAVNGGQLRSLAAGLARDGRQTVSILAHLAALAIPVRAVFQRDDAVIPARHALDLPANVAVHFFKGASHLPQWREPALVARLVAAAAATGL